MKTGRALLGVLAALVSGAVLGVIFAPDRDAETRRRGEELAEALNKSIDEKFDRLAGKMNAKRENDSLLTKKPEVN